MATHVSLRKTCLAVCCLLSMPGCAEQRTAANAPAADKPWTFAVSGDSRNCGNVVMPAIAADARNNHAAFYWHLGDLRAIYKVDEDYAREERFKAFSPGPNLSDYLYTAWSDFTQHQIRPFGDMPVYLGIGNHETIAPKTRSQFLIEFQPLLDSPTLAAQRAKDAAATPAIGSTAPRTYYHWLQRGVDFINLDNASDDTFDAAQLTWFKAVVDADAANPAVKTLVVGMHEALPYSKSDSHSMCGSSSGRETGTQVYARLADAQRKGKHVYVLASHSHYYLANNFDTEHWRDPANGGVVLPGWVIGTAGAERYALPSDVTQGPDAREHVYGYLLATVQTNGEVRFDFREFSEAQIQATRGSDYGADTVAFCFAQNPEPEKLNARRPHPVACDTMGQH